jgi:tripartite-type tricarboxylate transporter receptor subunit TctC
MVTRTELEQGLARPTDGEALTRRAILKAVGITAAGVLAAPALAQGISNRTVTNIVPFSPGTAPDILARRIAEAFQQRWAQSFLVENRPGASGTIGSTLVARATPDGHTLLVTPSTFAMSPSLYRNLSYDPVKSFAPVVQLTTIGFALLLHKSAGADVETFVKNAKARPGMLSYASPGRGTPHHLLMELFRQKTGIDVMHVPASNFSSAMTDLLGGRVAAMFTTVTIAKSLPADGSVKIAGVASPNRLPSLPDMPTLAELGFPGVQYQDWYAMFAPAGVSPEIVGKLNTTANEILATPDVKTWLASQGMVPAGGTPDQLRDLLADDLKYWAAIVRQAGIEPI